MAYVPLPLGSAEFLTRLDLGRSYKVNTQDFIDSEAVFVNIQDDQIFVSTPTYKSDKGGFIQTSDNVIETINMEASASLKVKMFTGEASGRFYLDTTSSAESIIMYQYIDVVNKILELNENSGLTVSEALLELPNKEAIAQQYGLHYIASLVYGGSMRVTYTMTNSDTKHIMDVKASLKANLDFTAIQAAVNAEAQYNSTTTGSKTSTSWTQESRGGNQAFQSININPNDINTLYAAINAFQVDQGGGGLDTGTMNVIGYRVKRIPKELVPALRDLAPEQLEALNANVGDVAQKLMRAYELKALAQNQGSYFDNLQDPVFNTFLRKQFRKVVSDVLTETDRVQREITDYLAQRQLEIAKRPYPGFNYGAQSELSDTVDSIRGMAYFPLTSHTGTSGIYNGYSLTVQETEVANWIGRWTPLRPSDRTSYNGEWLDGKWYGQGKAVYANGDIYEGQFFENERDGTGRIVYFDTGDIYNGSWANDLSLGTGKALIHYTNGNVYNGDIVTNKKQGNGLMTYIGDGYYQGQWRNDLFHGEGLRIFGNGTVNDGRWENGVFKTQVYNSILRGYPNNEYYYGDFIMNGTIAQRHEIGTQYDQYDNPIHAGRWHYDVYVGPVDTNPPHVDPPKANAHYTLASGEVGVFTGATIKGKAHGKGEFVYSDGSTFVGEWANGHRIRGKQHFKDGREYTGTFLKDRFHGKGVLKTHDGVYTGIFSHGKRNGRGTMQYKDGTIYDGMWRDDQRQGHGYLIKGKHVTFALWNADQIFIHISSSEDNHKPLHAQYHSF